jgi:hypothetical protein
VLAVVAASAGYGFGFVYAHRFTEGLSPLQLSLGQLAAGTVLASGPATPTCSTTAPSSSTARPSPRW